MKQIRPKNIAWISTRALEQNYRSICALLRENRGTSSPPMVIATVKANGYGHGVDTVTEVLGNAGCRFFAVSSETEALEVRRLEENRGRHPRILILGYTFPENAPVLAAADLECAVVSPAHGEALAAVMAGTGLTLGVHIKLDTGMHRVGFSCDTEERAGTTVADVQTLSRTPGINLCGIFTHFACCDDELLPPDGLSSVPEGVSSVPEGVLTQIQWERYQRVLEGLAAKGVSVGIRHVSNSAAILAYAPAWLDAVRAGILLYGMSPNGRPWVEDRFCPAMTLSTVVAHIQTLLPGEHVSYGATYTAKTQRTLATLPIGYGDGWIRAYSGATVRIGDIECPVVGRICMDQCMVDITGYEDRIHVGDRVVLFGEDRGESVSRLAKKAGTIVYECTCQVSARVPRVPFSGEIAGD